MASPFDFLFPPSDSNTQTQQMLPGDVAPQVPGAVRPTPEPFGALDVLGIGSIARNQQREFDRQAGREFDQNSAQGNILKRLNELKQENPDMARNMLQQRLFADPVWNRNITQVDASKMMDVVNKVQEGIYGEDKYMTTPADSSVLKVNPAAGQTTPQEVYRTPKTIKPGDYKEAVAMSGNDKRLTDLGMNLPGDKQYEVTYGRDPEGRRVITNISGLNNGVTVNMGDQVEVDAFKKANTTAERMRQRQAAISDAVAHASRIEDLLDSEGAKGVGPLGLANRFGQAMLEQAQAGAAQAGIIMDPAAYADQWKLFKGLDKTGANSAAIQSNILALAYTLARANNNGVGNITKKDVDQALQQLGANFGSTKQMKAAMREMVGQSIDSFDRMLAIEEPAFKGTSGKAMVTAPRKMSELLEESGLGQYVKKPRAGQAGAPGSPNSAIATGDQFDTTKIYNFPDGTKRRFKGGANVPGNWEIVK